jgi:hypothetical protein
MSLLLLLLRCYYSNRWLQQHATRAVAMAVTCHCCCYCYVAITQTVGCNSAQLARWLWRLHVFAVAIATLLLLKPLAATVRNSHGGIVQFRYGDDGLDPCLMENDEGRPINLKRMMQVPQKSPACSKRAQFAAKSPLNGPANSDKARRNRRTNSKRVLPNSPVNSKEPY